jgi:hypothetical protein
VTVSGSHVGYTDVDRLLGRSIVTALAPIETRAATGPRRFTLSVELTDARAEYSGGRLVIGLTARATLRDRTGNTYLAQTHAHANASRALPPEHGGTVAVACANAIGEQLAGWLLGFDLS